MLVIAGKLICIYKIKLISYLSTYVSSLNGSFVFVFFTSLI